MKPGWFILAAVAAILASVIAPKPQHIETPAPVPAKVEVVSDAQLADELAGSPLAVLFDVNSGGGIDTLQGRDQTLPAGWAPEDPYDMSAPMPSADEIRTAIRKGVNYVLDQQNENGSWDVVLTGDLLAQTADQAVDAIAITSLAGYALRRHIKVDPARIEPALQRAAQFVFDRVYRGKLPMNVQYANWRYTMGLKFLHQEYLHSSDEEYRNEIRSVCRRLVMGLLKLQRSNDPTPALEKKRRTRISSRFKDSAMPAQFGVVLAPPTDEDYRGGARVIRIIEGSAAQRTGIKVGDRIVELEHLRVENSLDYYMQEAGFLGGQKITMKVRRDGGASFKVDVQLDQTWPGYLGLKLAAGSGSGPVVEGFLPFSPAQEDIEVGDIIYEVDGNEVKTIDDVRSVERTVKPGDKIRVKVLRGEKQRKKSASIEVVGAPEGWFYFRPVTEDKGDEDGVVVDGAPAPGTPAADAGLRDGDRILWIGDTPILGFDHLVEFVGSIAAGVPYKLIVIRDGSQIELEAIARAIPQPFDLTAKWDVNRRNWTVSITEVDAGGVADKAGMKKGDVFVKINGQDVRNIMMFQRVYFGLSAGETVTFTMQRGNKEVDVTFVLPKAPETASEEFTEEGGWLYYPQMDEAPSFCTAAAMLVLMDADKDLEIKGLSRIIKDPLKAAANLINSHRVIDPENGGEEAYVYYHASKTMGQVGIDIKGAQGRNAICELALVRMSMFRRSKSTLRRMIDQFVRNRGELDAVRNLILYGPAGRRPSPHNYDRNFNAAYYWMYGHYHTLLAAREVGGKTFDEVNEICVKAVIQDQEDDGTWLEHQSFGKLCGTSLALWILGETEGPWRDGYGDPTTQEKKDGPTTAPDK